VEVGVSLVTVDFPADAALEVAAAGDWVSADVELMMIVSPAERLDSSQCDWFTALRVSYRHRYTYTHIQSHQSVNESINQSIKKSINQVWFY